MCVPFVKIGHTTTLDYEEFTQILMHDQMTYTEPMSNPSKSSESSNSIWYIFLTSDCTNREEYGRVLQKVTLHTCPYNIHHIMYTKQGMVGRVRIWVEIGVHNYITTLTLTTKGTNTFLRRRFNGAWRTRNPFSTRSTRFTTVLLHPVSITLCCMWYSCREKNLWF